MRLTIILLIALALAAPAQAQYGYYYPPVVKVIKEVQQVVVQQLITVPTPVQLFQVTPQAITTQPPVYVAYRPRVEAKADPGCSPELTARLARIEQALAAMAMPHSGPPMLSDGPPRLRAAQAPQAPPPLKLHPETGAVVRLMQVRCSECHTAPGRGGVVLFNEQGEFEPNVSKSEILAAVKPGKDASGAARPARMPKGKPASLAAEEIALIERWAKNN